MGQYFKPIAVKERGNPIIGWCSPYDYGNGAKLMEHSWIGNDFVSSVESLLIPGGKWYKESIVWGGDYADKESGTNETLYGMCTDKTKLKPKVKVDPTEYRYIVNHTKKLFVDKARVPGGRGEWTTWKIHPLPLLTAEGNNRGGGDYRGEDEIIGSWARNSISIETIPPAGYDEINFTLTE